MSSLASASNSSRTPADVRPAFAALVLAMLPAVLDQTVLATALPTVATDLGRLGDVSWLVTAYVVTATAATPLWGKLGDRNGRRPMLIAALTGFLCASAVCGLAQNLEQLIAARAVQGLAAGGLMSLAMASVGDLVAPRERARWQGRISVVFASATVVGPVLGGVVVQHVSWRWVFYLNLPLGVAALFGIRRWLGRRGGADASTPLDLPGALHLGGATVCALLACSWAGDRFGWLSLPVAALAAGCLLLLTAFVRRERRTADPLVPLELLAIPTVRIAAAGLFLATAALFSVTVFVPVGLQASAGLSPTDAGLLLAAMTIGITAATLTAGRSVARSGRLRRLPPLGCTLMACGLVGLGLTVSSGSPLVVPALVVFGAGFGLTSQLLVVAVQNGVARERIGIATSTTSFFRALGGAVGAATLGTVFAALRQPTGDAVRDVLLLAAPIALLAGLVVLRLPADVDRSLDAQ
jgi:EmrB/QacA subfamily drug resistance transporter